MKVGDVFQRIQRIYIYVCIFSDYHAPTGMSMFSRSTPPRSPTSLMIRLPFIKIHNHSKYIRQLTHPFPSLTEARAENTSIGSYFHLGRVGSSLLQFTWDVPSLMKLKVSLVKVSAKPISSSGIVRYETASVSAGKVTVDALESYTLYNVTVETTGEGTHLMHPMGLVKTWPTGEPKCTLPIFSIFIAQRLTHILHLC